jgi:hypothetical protein
MNAASRFNAPAWWAFPLFAFLLAASISDPSNNPLLLNAQSITGSGDFECSPRPGIENAPEYETVWNNATSSWMNVTLIQAKYDCKLEGNFPFNGVQSLFATGCVENDFVEPSADVCSTDCVVIVGRNNVAIGTCQSCSILPDANPTDGFFQIAYDCSNVLQGSCVGRNATFGCIDNTPDDAPRRVGGVVNTSFACEAGAAGTPLEGSYGCLYKQNGDWFPFYQESFLFAVCTTDELTFVSLNEECSCGIYLGSYANASSAIACASCQFIEDSTTSEEDYMFAYDCRYV